MDILTENSNEIKDLFSSLDEKSNIMDYILENNTYLNVSNRFLSNKQVCEILNISERTLQDYRNKRLISYYKLEGKILYKFSDIEKLLKENYIPSFE